MEPLLLGRLVDLNLRCDNRSWATVRGETTLDRHGNDVAVYVAKMAYSAIPAGDRCRVTLAFRPVRWSDISDGHGALTFPSDLVEQKSGTDVGLIGTAHPPRGKVVERQLAWLTMGPLRKVVHVIGKRSYVSDYKGMVPGPAAPLGPTPLRHENCYGGVDTETIDGVAIAREEPLNPVGRGFALQPISLVGKLAPALEPAVDPTTGRTPHPSEGCFAPVPGHWDPRRGLAGSHDEAWARTRAPVRPRDFDLRHHHWAVPGLHAESPLHPDDPIEVGGVLPEGLWKFRLPKYAVSFRAQLAGEEPREIKTHLDSVLIDADERVVELSWRASVVLPKKWELFEKMFVSGEGTLPPEVLEDDKRDPRAPVTTAAVAT